MNPTENDNESGLDVAGGIIHASIAGLFLWLVIGGIFLLFSTPVRAGDIIWKKTPADAIQTHCHFGYRKDASNDGFSVLGCQYMQQTSFMHWSCIVEVPDTYPEEQLKNVLRHEVKHCVRGAFHYNIPHYSDSMDTDLPSYNKQYEELIATGTSTY